MPLWLSPEPLVLASRSKVRQTLLAAAGIPIDVRPADLDERELEAQSPSQQPGAVATFLAREKALSVELSNPGRLVLGADQLLALDGKRFSKPGDRASARAQLLELSRADAHAVFGDCLRGERQRAVRTCQHGAYDHAHAL